jgi:serine/threonine protein kinase
VAIKVLRAERLTPKDYVRTTKRTRTHARMCLRLRRGAKSYGFARCRALSARAFCSLFAQALHVQEVRLLSSFDHPHVLRFVGACCDSPHACIGAHTPPLRCGPIFARRRCTLPPRSANANANANGSPQTPHERTGDPPPPPARLAACRALRYGAQVCAAMAYLHGRGVIHRDLKSANILLDRRLPPPDATYEGSSYDPGDNVKVGDFGLSRVLATLFTPLSEPLRN